MATPLILKSFHLFQFTQDSILHRKSIIGWNINLKRFYSEKKPINILRWLISVSTVIINILSGLIFLACMLSGKLDVKRLIRLNANEFFITFYSQLICIVVLAFDYTLFNYRHVLVIYLDKLLYFIPTPDKISKRYAAPWYTDTVGCIGTALMLSLYSGGILFVLICGLEIVDCTMLPVAIDYIFPPENSRSWKFFLVKFAVSMIFHWEMCLELATCLIMVLVVIIYIVTIHFSHLRAISRLTNMYFGACHLQHLLRTYQQLRVLHSVILEPSSKIVAIIMGFGFYVMIISMSLLVYGWYFLSPWVYPLIPFVCLICFTILVVALPLAPLALQCSESLLHRWSKMPEKFRGGRRYLKRLFKSLRPTQFICGGVGVLDRDRSTMYVASIIESSMTCLLLFGTIIKAYI